MSSYRLLLLGEAARLEGADGTATLGRNALALLVYLALAGPTPRERLAGLLWPERSESRARGNLRQLVHRLRSDDLLQGGDPLRLGEGVEVDLHAAERRLDSIADGAAPMAPLAPVDVGDRPELEAYLDAERHRFQQRVTARLSGEVERHADAGERERALAAARRWAAFDPFDEAAHRRVMELHLDGDDPRSALLAYRRCRSALARGLDAEPCATTRRVAERAATQAARALPTSRSASAPPTDATRDVLPSAASVARRAEIGGWSAEALALLRAAAGRVRTVGPLGELLVGIAWLEHRRGSHAAAREAARRGLSLLRRGTPARSLVDARFVLGSLARSRGQHERARRCWSAALDGLASGEGDRAELTLRLNVGLVEDALGHEQRATRCYLEAMPLARRLGDVRALATVLNNLGHVLIGRGRAEEGSVLLQRAYRFARDLADRQLQGYLLDGLATARLELREPREARVLASRALELAHALDDHGLRIETLLTLARAERELGEPERATAAHRTAMRLARDAGVTPRASTSNGSPRSARAEDASDRKGAEAWPSY